MTFVKKWKYPSRCNFLNINTKEYEIWNSMIKRAGSRMANTHKTSTYQNCTICSSWESYDNFYEWVTSQIGFNSKDEAGKCYALDKDILFKGNKHYSPETCVFVPREINNFYTTRKRHRGDCLIGTTKKNSGFQVSLNLGNGKSNYFGVYESNIDAFNKYKIVKESYAKQLAIKWTGLVDPRVIDALNNFTVNIED